MKKALALFLIFAFGALLAQPPSFTILNLGLPYMVGLGDQSSVNVELEAPEVATVVDREGEGAPLEADENFPTQQLMEEEEEKHVFSVKTFWKPIQINTITYTHIESSFKDVDISIVLPPPELV